MSDGARHASRPRRQRQAADPEDLAREIRAHLELETEERIADGEAPDQARHAARRAFGNVMRVHEDARAVWIPPWLDHVGQDLRYAARRLRRTPAFTLAATGILTLGIGLNLAGFHLFNVIALRPLAVADVDTLVRFDRVTKRFSSNGIPYPATQFIRQHNDVLSSVLTSSASDVVWGDDLNDRVDALYVSANWFTELGYGAAQGRLFAEALDERSDASPVVVVSHEFWQTRLQGRSVTGRTVRVNNRPATVIGVVPSAFPGLRMADVQVWLPIHQIDYFNPGTPFLEDWRSHSTQLYGRLRPGTSLAAARDGLLPTLLELTRTRPAEFEAGETLVPHSGRDFFRGPRDRAEVRTSALLAGALMFAVLLVACTNLSSLVLSQGLNRIREFSLRSALGASRWRIVRQQVIEAALITASGTIGAAIVGYWGARLAARQLGFPPMVGLEADWRTAAAACALGSAALAAIGLAPSWMVSRGNPAAGVRNADEPGRGLAGGRFRLFLMASQIAGCCLLLVVAGSTVRGLQRIVRSDLGFEFAQIAVLDPSLSRYGLDSAAAQAFWAETRRAIDLAPDVDSVALASQSPFGSRGSRSIFNDAPRLTVSTLAVEPAFFSLLRIPIIAGRTFDLSDTASTAVIISRRLAMDMYGSVDVVGRAFPRLGPAATVVGVAADAPLAAVGATSVAERYIPIEPRDYPRLVLLARSRTSAERLLIPLQDAARSADSRVLPRTTVPSARFGELVRGRQVSTVALTAAGLLATGLACFGIFAIVAQGAAARSKEIGIRRALGADALSVVCLFLRQLSIPVVLGVLAGAAGGHAVGTLLEGDPFFLPPVDTATLVAALLPFVVLASSAAFGAASRALRADPLDALRCD